MVVGDLEAWTFETAGFPGGRRAAVTQRQAVRQATRLQSAFQTVVSAFSLTPALGETFQVNSGAAPSQSEQFRLTYFRASSGWLNLLTLKELAKGLRRASG